MGINKQESFSQIKAELKERFPLSKKIPGQSVELKIKDFKHTTRSKDIYSYQFLDKKRGNRVIIDDKKLVFETNKYKGFVNLYENIEFITGKFEESYPLEKINSIGLRYINQIDITPPKKPLNWKNLINSDLTCVPDNFLKNGGLCKDNMSRSMHFLEMSEEDYRLRFQFGMFNSEYPNSISKKEFVLDYDCITIGEISPNDTLAITKKFNNIIYNWFEMSIGSELKDMMKDEGD